MVVLHLAGKLQVGNQQGDSLADAVRFLMSELHSSFLAQVKNLS